MTDAEQHELAGEILDQALRQLIDEGFDRLEAVQTVIAFGLDMLPAMVCQHHLVGEYEDLAATVADRLKAIPALRPGVDVARCTH